MPAEDADDDAAPPAAPAAGGRAAAPARSAFVRMNELVPAVPVAPGVLVAAADRSTQPVMVTLLLLSAGRAGSCR
jgi:hypothetical protein